VLFAGADNVPPLLITFPTITPPPA
jgi:hypothetical protein